MDNKVIRVSTDKLRPTEHALGRLFKKSKLTLPEFGLAFMNVLYLEGVVKGTNYEADYQEWKRSLTVREKMATLGRAAKAGK